MIKKILHALTLYISILIPKSSKIYVFGSWFGNKFADNPKYMFLAMRKREDINCIWITKNENIYREMKTNGYRTYMSNSLKGMYYQFRAKYVFICTDVSDVNQYCIGGSYIINFFHGVIGKKVGYDDHKSPSGKDRDRNLISMRMKSFPYRKTFYTITERKYYRIFQSAFHVKSWQLILNGQPRNDLFFDRFLDEKSEDVFSEKRIILYMPTHRAEGHKKMNVSQIFDLDTLEKICRKKDWYFIIKKHYYHASETNDFDNKKYEHIIDITSKEYDTQYLLKCANILVTDYSSCYIDYLLLDRPIIFYFFDYETYIQDDRDMYFPYEEITPGKKTKTIKDFSEYLDYVITNNVNDGYKEERLRVRRFFYDDTTCINSCDKVKKLIDSHYFENAYKKRHIG